MTAPNACLVRTHSADDVDSRAVYSACERYRYDLTRVWDADRPRLLYVMLNPSKATETANDPTIERCQRRAVALGYGAMGIANLFAWRETDPKALRKAPEPIGPETDRLLLASADWADDVLCAWGVHGVHRGRDMEVRSLLAGHGARLLVLGETKDGHPRHPLYMPYAAAPQPWQIER